VSSPPWAADTDEVPPGRRTGELVAGKYRLVRSIGRGGMGEVYEAQHAIVGRRFALKFLHAHLAQSGSALVRFRREAEAAGALESEHIAAVTDFDKADDGAPFLVMEYLDGESLGQLLHREGPLPLARVVGALLQVCRGLEQAHAAGIIHRDLKPDNLFLQKRSDGSDLVKILDFGIAKLNRGEAAADITRSGAMLGTPFYMSPEQARGEKAIGERADIYSLGVILYELLSGHKPHPGDSYNSILAHILSRPVVPLETLRPGLPQGFAAVVERALSPLAEARQPSAAALAKELAPYAGREVSLQHSHFDLRVPRGGSPTLRTPDAHTLSVANDEPLAKSAPAAPNREHQRARPETRKVVPAMVLGVTLVSLLAVGWWRARPEARVDVPASTASVDAAEPRQTPREPSATPPPVATTQPPSATVAPAASALPSAATALPRGVVRPANRATLRPALSKASPSAGASAQPAVNPPRVIIDDKNPY
jgi:serine/threonine protein kinase